MDPSGLPAAPLLEAAAHWRTVDFISDLHLQAADMATFDAWRCYLDSSQADALFILGDLFEVWVGDDVLDADAHADFETDCQRLLAAVSTRMALYLMHGNRDFLLGDRFARACHLTLLDDPTVLAFDQQRWLLSHGDALCLDDTDYQQFRAIVRSADWRQGFLARPLSERLAVARELRAQSEARKRSGVTYADVDDTMVRHWLQAAQAQTLIHGHTHRPGDHVLRDKQDFAAEPAPLRRLVLSDWDAQATPPRLQVLRLQSGQTPQRMELSEGASD